MTISVVILPQTYIGPREIGADHYSQALVSYEVLDSR